jgi:hypothetical protein
MKSMMTGREMMFAVVIAALAASLLLEILGFVVHTLPNFLRRAKIKKNSVNTNPDFAMLATMLKDMQSLGLTKLKPDEDEKPAIAGETSRGKSVHGEQKMAA